MRFRKLSSLRVVILWNEATLVPLGASAHIPGQDEHAVVDQKASHPETVPNSQASHPPELPGQRVESVTAVVEHARESTGRLKGYGGTAMDSVATATSSGLCNSLLGSVNKVVQIGDVVSKVTSSRVANCSSFDSIIRSIRMRS
jgi:hypothetical protein